MEKSIKGTRTEQNLLKAFAGESQARSRYVFFASKAKKEGYEQIAGVFAETAEQEKEHAERFFKFLEGGMVEITASYPAGKIGTTQENLLAAAQGEEAAPETQDVSDLALRESVIAYGKKLVENRLIQATWGNVSARIDADRFLITPSGVDYDRIRPEDIVEIRIADGSFAAGQRPSSEREMHRRIYAARGDVRAVIHTHSAALQTFAACRESLRTPEIVAPCAAYGVSGSKKLAESASEVLRSHDLCIMANHGFTAVAADLETALSRAVAAEEAAKRILESE